MITLNSKSAASSNIMRAYIQPHTSYDTVHTSHNKKRGYKCKKKNEEEKKLNVRWMRDYAPTETYRYRLGGISLLLSILKRQYKLTHSQSDG